MATERNASFGTRALLLATRIGARLFHNSIYEEAVETGTGISSSDEDEEEEEQDSEEETSNRNKKKSKTMESVLAQEIKKATSAKDETIKLARSKKGNTVHTVSMLAGREINTSGFSRAEACHLSSRFLPTEGPDLLMHKNSRMYISQFSTDGSLFIAGFQDRTIIIYDVNKDWSIRKTVTARNLRWTITDTALSPDQRFLVYASINPVVHLVNLGNETGGIESLANVTDIHEGLSFATDEYDSDGSFGIWSLKFSQDGTELVAGSNDNCIYVYDLNVAKTTFRVNAHLDEVNAVAFADDSGNIIFSGSDDCICKVWDRRCFSGNRPAGKVLGHLGGITFIDSRGDGRHFISNSKDQTIKLWDIRTMSSAQESVKQSVPTFRWDYRYMRVPQRLRTARHPRDESLMTYRGHEVLQTLIRCYFSPAASTAQKYIYTGTYNGDIYIYDLVSGEVAAKLRYHNRTVRDCSWHPWQPVLVSSCWGGNLARWNHLKGEYTRGFRNVEYDLPDASYVEFYDSDD